MVMKMAANNAVDFSLRTLQFLFAVIVLGTTGRAIYEFHGYTSHEHFWFGNFDLYNGVPAAWSFLVFCAAWTILGAIFLLVTRIHFADRPFVGYIRVGVEAVALLSWLAGFIAVAVNIGSQACPKEESGCRLLEAATVFGGVEWLLFVVTTFLTTKLAFSKPARPTISAPETSQTSAPPAY